MSALRHGKMCRFCQRSFARNEHLSRHERSHLKSKPFECDLCDKSFGRNDVLIRHKRLRHDEESPSGENDVHANLSLHSPQMHQDLSTLSTAAATLSEHPEHFQDININNNILDSNYNVSQSRLPVSPPTASSPLEESYSKCQYTTSVSSETTLPSSSSPQPVEAFVNPMSFDWTDVFTEFDYSQNSSNNNDLNNPLWNFFLGGDPSIDFADLATFPSPEPTAPLEITSTQQQNSFSEPHQFVNKDGNMIASRPPSRSHNATPFLHPESVNHDDQSQTSVDDPLKHVYDAIAAAWPTRHSGASNQNSYKTTLVPKRPGEGRIDQIDRDHIEADLLYKQPGDYEPLPSTEFLNVAVRLWFRHCLYSLPIIHPGTFSPSTYPILTLMMAACGTIYMTEDDIPAHINFPIPLDTKKIAHQLYERVQSSHLATWECRFKQSRQHQLAVLQTGVLLTAFGLLSGDQFALAQSHLISVAMVNLARRAEFYRPIPDYRPPPPDASQQQLETAWRAFADAESRKRTATAQIYQTAWLAVLFRSTSSISLSAMDIALSCDNSIFIQPTAALWAQRYRELNIPAPLPRLREVMENDLLLQQPRSSSHFPLPLDKEPPCRPGLDQHGLFFALAFILAWAVSLDNDLFRPFSDRFDPARNDARICLLRWWQVSPCISHEEQHLPLSYPAVQGRFHVGARVMWNQAGFHLSVSVDLLEILAGRDGMGPAREKWSLDRISSWVTTASARLALLHAAQVYSLCKHANFPTRDEGGLHVAHAIFQAALIVWTFVRFYKPRFDGNNRTKRQALDLTQWVDWVDVVSCVSDPNRDPQTDFATYILHDDCQKYYPTLGSLPLYVNRTEPAGHPTTSSQAIDKIILDNFAKEIERTTMWGISKQLSKLLYMLSEVTSSPILVSF